MKSTLIKSLKITVIFSLFLSLSYVLVIWVFAQFFSPNKGKVELVMSNGKVVGAANIGQKFTKDIYFWGRPSAVNYTADASGGSNYGPTNEQHLKEIETRVESFLIAHPYLSRTDIPAEIVTASGSGLDPDISPEAAYVQIKRVAKARNLKEDVVMALVEKQIEKPLLGMFGPEKINVLKLNVALDQID